MPYKRYIFSISSGSTAILLICGILFNREMVAALEANSYIVEETLFLTQVQKVSDALENSGINARVDEIRNWWRKSLGIDLE